MNFKKLFNAKFAAIVAAFILSAFMMTEVSNAQGWPSYAPGPSWYYAPMWLRTVQVRDQANNIIFNVSPSTYPGFQNPQPSSAMSWVAGETYTVSMTGVRYPQSGGSNYAFGVSLFCDFNGDGVYANDGGPYTHGSHYIGYQPTANGTLTATITVPMSARGKKFRMRIVDMYGPYYSSYGPLTPYTYTVSIAQTYYCDWADFLIDCPVPPDASATQIVQPSGAITKGTQSVSVRIKNNIDYPLTSARVVWRIDEGLPTQYSNTFSWTGNLGLNEQADVTVGTYDFNEFRTYTIDGFTELPNGKDDINPGNDRAPQTQVSPALSVGEYYVGPMSGASNTFSDPATAFNYLSAAGAVGNGDLTFIFPDDMTYSGPLAVSNFPRVGTGKFILKSLSNDKNRVKIQYAPSIIYPYALALQGLNDIEISGITFEALNTNGRGGLIDLQACNNVSIMDNQFSGIAGAPQNNNYVSINCGLTYNIHIHNNTFTNNAIAFNETSFCPRKIMIEGNTFTNLTWKFLQLVGNSSGSSCTENDVIIDDNQFVGNNAPNGILSTNGTEITNNSFTGFRGSTANDAIIYVTNNDPVNFTGTTIINDNTLSGGITDINCIYSNNVPSVNIQNNVINVLEGTAGIMSGIRLAGSGTSTTPAYVRENTITMSNSSNNYGLYMLNSNANVNYNDIDLKSPVGASVYCIYSIASTGYIANSQIGTNNATNIYLDNSSMGVYYNSFANESALRPTISINSGTNDIHRNLFQNFGFGPAINAVNASGNSIDENNYYSSGSIVGIWSGAPQTTLAAWQSISGMDMNSTNLNVQFIDFTSFDLGLNLFDESLVFETPLTFANPNWDEEIQAIDYNGKPRNSYFMGSENIIPEIFITSNPVGVMDCYGALGHSISVSAFVTRGVQAQYEWFKDGVSLTEYYDNPGTDVWAQKASLYLDSIALLSAPGLDYSIEGTYRCLVKGSGAAPQYTDYVLVNVLSPASITRQPEDQRVVLGNEVLFEVEAHIVAGGGVDDPFYQPEVQWYRGSIANPIEDDFEIDGHFSGAKSTILSIRNVSLDEIGDDYFVVLRGKCDSLYSETVSLKEFPDVIITEQPANVTGCEGTDAIFSVSASSLDPEATISYQWRKDGIVMPGKTDVTLTLTAISDIDAGTYDCIITVLPGGNSKTSNAANLTVDKIPVITTHPADQNPVPGSPFILLVQADFGITYQWYKDDVIIDGATSSSFSVVSATLTDAGLYKCEVGNPCGTVMSNAANVTVDPDGMTDVTDVTNGGLTLSANTPNPFNENTIIRFNTPKASHIRLTITDVYGKEIAVLADGVYSNWNSVNINASQMKLSSGVYYYTLSSGTYKLTQKMVVVR